MLGAKVVVACGACACGGGVYQTCYNIRGGVDTVIPVDAYVPGCAVKPSPSSTRLLQAGDTRREGQGHEEESGR